MIGRMPWARTTQGCQCQEGADSGENGSQIDARALSKRSDDEHFSARTLLRNLGVFSEISQLNVPRPQRRRRKFSQGEKRMRSATRPMTTMTIMMATTWSMA